MRTETLSIRRENMTIIKKKISLEKENQESKKSLHSSRKTNYLQFIERRYRRMTDADFVKAFENDHEDEPSEFYTQIQAKYLPFFKNNIDRIDYNELQEQYECGDANWSEWLDSYPEIIEKLPTNTLCKIRADELIGILINHPDKAELLLPILYGEDAWALLLPTYNAKIRRIAIKLCPWETLTISQKRYMSLKSPALKKIISEM